MNYHSNIKSSPEFALAKNITYNLVLSIFLTLIIAVLSIHIFGLRLDIVLSDSMSPTFYKDDIVIVKEFKDYKIGDIVEFDRGVSKPVTHRIVKKDVVNGVSIYTTQGDANDKPEEYTITNDVINGKVIAIIEDGNHIYEYFKKNYFLLIDLLLGVWALTSTLNGELEMRRHNIAKVQ